MDTWSSYSPHFQKGESEIFKSNATVELTGHGATEQLRRITLDAKVASRGSDPTICWVAFTHCFNIYSRARHPLKEVECKLSNVLMNCCAVNSLSITADVHNFLSVSVAFCQKCIVSYFAGKNRQGSPLDEIRIPLRIGDERSYFVCMPYNDADGYLYLT